VLPNVGIEEIGLLLILALLLFGADKLPEMARSLGKGVRDFKTAIGGLDVPEAPLPSPVDAQYDVDPPAPPPVADETF
jgi:sec-independent protein translocase protein TatA